MNSSESKDVNLLNPITRIIKIDSNYIKKQRENIQLIQMHRQAVQKLKHLFSTL